VPPAHDSSQSTIVVCEDDEGLRLVVKTILSAHGYRVLPAAGAEQALELAAAHPGAIDVLVTDFQLPQMTGGKLIRELKDRLPRLEVLVLTGHPVDSLPGPPLPAGCAFLQKPVSDTALLETVEHLLERTEAADAPRRNPPAA